MVAEAAASDGQARATLAAARREDGTAGAGAHAQAETVRLVTAAVVRLVSTLAHGCFLSGVVEAGRSPGTMGVALGVSRRAVSTSTARPRLGDQGVDLRHP